jgi:hypothetical protein
VEAAPGIVNMDFGNIFLSDRDGQGADITVKIRLNSDAITAYNAAQGTNYEVIPAGAITYNTNFTIARGSKEVNFPAAVNMGMLNLTKNYAMAYTIESVTGGNGVAINKTYETLFIAFSVKNKYDGLWRMNGTLVDVANGALGAWTDALVAFETSGPSSVIMINRVNLVPAWFNVPFHPISSAGAFSVYGGWAPVFTFNATDNLITVTNYYGQPNPGNTRGAVIDPTGANVFTSTGGVKTIRAKYIMTQPSVVAAPPHHRTFCNMTFTYLGPR